MRADRLVSLVLLLRQRGRMTARELARLLEVSERTVLRDIEALSVAGVPVYADRGRYGGFSLLSSFRTELTGLNHDEALALLAARAGSGKIFGLDAALISAISKVVDTLPPEHQSSVNNAARHLLIEPELDLLSRRSAVEAIPKDVMKPVRHAVFAGHKLRLHYAAPGKDPNWRTVDPLGLVTVRGHAYLLATKDGADRTYRLSRILAAEQLSEPAERPEQLDLQGIWEQRSAQFLAANHLVVVVRVHASRRQELLDSARAVHAVEEAVNGWVQLKLSFDDLRHALWAIWQLDTDAEVLSPEALRTALAEQAAVLMRRYGTG